MKRFLIIVILLSIGQLGCASQSVNLCIYDAFTNKALNDARVTLYVSHPPKDFLGVAGTKGAIYKSKNVGHLPSRIR